ncbi:MAG: sigma-54-dependent transcriptional regulator [Candidatus Aminicenantia bacterium]
MNKDKILIIDDEIGVRTSLSGILEDEGYYVKAVENGEEGLDLLRRENYDLVLLDIWLPGQDGIEILKKIKENGENIVVVMISGHGTIETAVRSTKLGAYDFLEKPLSLEKVHLTVKNALKHKKLEEENIQLKEKIKSRYVLIGESPPIKKLREEIRIAAPTNGRVLIYGENGTGKELVARLIHEQSLRKEKRFMEINCAAIPDDLIESELFGYVKGAFTNAFKDKKGKLFLADGGTLFLDEIGDMSLRIQAKLLRVIEEQKFEPLGSTESISIDARIIAATNKDLRKEINAGRFREDLFFRLNVIPFRIPPLRERKEDIPLLVNYFLKYFSVEYRKKLKVITPKAMEVLTDYYWPGNVRELKNMIERLIIMVQDEEIKVSDLPLSIISPQPEESFRVKQYRSFQEAKEAFEKEFIQRKLWENNWNITKTAHQLQIERSNLYKKIKAFGIELKR